MKKLVSIIILCLGCMGFLGAQNVWKNIGMDGEFLGVSANGDMFCDMGYDGLFRSQDEGATWEALNVASYVRKETFMINEQERIFVFNENTHKLCFSDDNGDTWQEQASGISTNWPLGMFSLSNDTIFIASIDKFFWTLDGGESWDETPIDFIDDAQFGSILADHAGNVYVSTYSWTIPVEHTGIYTATLDDLTQWTVKTQGGARDMAFDSEGNILAASPGTFLFDNGVYFVNADRFALASDDVIFAMKRVDWDNEALFYSTDHGQTYVQCSENIPSTTTAPDPDLGLYKGRDNHLYCHGDVWEPEFESQYYKSISRADYILENFPLENTAWVQFYRSMYEDSTYYQLGIKGDTLVNETTYKKVINCAHLGYPIEGECFGGIREDADGKCYFMSFVPGIYAPWPLHYDCEVNTEYPLYDFSLSVCDIFQMDGGTPNVVFDTDEMELNGSTRKVLWFGNNCDSGNPYEWQWIEGIGSTHSLLYPIQYEPDNGPEYRLVEVWQDEEMIYRNPHFDSNGGLVITPDTLWFDEMYYYEKTFIINNPTDQQVTITEINSESSIVRITYFNGSFVPVEELLPITLQAHEGIELIVELDVVWPWAKRDEFINVPINIISTAGHDVITLMIGKEATSFGLVAYPPYVQLDYYNPARFGVVSSQWDQPITITAIEEVGTNYLEIIPDSLLPVTLQNYGDFLSGSVRMRDGIHEFFETEIRISSTYGNAYIGVDNSLGFLAPFGNEWYYEIQNENGSITYQYMYQAGDTIINNDSTHILVKINTLYDKDIHTDVTHEYVYERDGKVYWWNNTLEEFTVLYDFGAEEGDTWVTKVGTETLIMHVDAVETVEYEGKTYRMLRVSDVDDIFSGDIVCGIGHLTSFFPEKLMDNRDRISVEGLRCYWIEDELVFKPGDDDCDAVYSEVHGVEEDILSMGSGSFTVYPNPTNGVLFVETRHGTSLPDQTYSITNLMGQTVLTGRLIAEVQRIDVSNLLQGMYFITIGKETRKFVVNR